MSCFFIQGLEEEKIIYSRCKNRKVYLNLVVNTIKRLRDESKKLEPKSLTPQKVIGNRVVSHEMILNGPQAKNCSIEKRQKNITLDDMNNGMIYNVFKRYVLTLEQLKEYGYPMPNPEKLDEVILPKPQSKVACDFSSNRRTCFRCQKLFSVNEHGVPIKPETCVYHSGRLWMERCKYYIIFVQCNVNEIIIFIVNGSVERKYSCCKGEPGTGGCCANKYHVVDGLSHPNYLKDYIKTTNKEPPIDGDFGIYALDCEMVNRIILC